MKRAEGYANSPARLKDCWRKVAPAFNDLSHVIIDAPLSDDDKKYLALYAMGHMMGTAVALMQIATPSLKDQPHAVLAQKILELLIPVMEQAEASAKH